jgi:hypothetical protein
VKRSNTECLLGDSWKQCNRALPTIGAAAAATGQRGSGSVRRTGPSRAVTVRRTRGHTADAGWPSQFEGNLRSVADGRQPPDVMPFFHRATTWSTHRGELSKSVTPPIRTSPRSPATSSRRRRASGSVPVLRSPPPRPPPTVRRRTTPSHQGRRVGRARAPGFALPRRRHGRGDHAPHRRERQRPLGQPQGDPRRRLPARPRLGDRGVARHRGRRPARRTIGRLCEGRCSSCGTPTTPPAPRTAYLRSIDGKTASLLATACRIGGIVAEAAATHRSRRSPRSATPTAWPSRSSTTCSTSSPPRPSSASRPATTWRRACTRWPHVPVVRPSLRRLDHTDPRSVVSFGRQRPKLTTEAAGPCCPPNDIVVESIDAVETHRAGPDAILSGFGRRGVAGGDPRRDRW